MANGDMDNKIGINPKEIEDAEVLTKSVEIDINEAEKTGADLSEAKQYLEEARTHLRNLDIKQVRISVKKAQTAAADAKRYHRAELLIQHALPVVDDARRAGADAKGAQTYIEKAREALKNRMYGDLSEYVRTAKREAKEAKRYHRAYLMIENCRTDIANAKMAGADVTEAEAYIDSAVNALENRDYGVVSQFVKNAKTAAIKLEKYKMVEELIAGVKPEVEDIKRYGLRTEEIEETIREAEIALQKRDYAEVRSLVRKIKRKIKRTMERKGANVLLATIEHVIHKAKAKGFDVTRAQELLDRAYEAIEKMNYIELEKIVSETNSIARDMNIPVGSLAGDLFSKAKLVDLDKIDMVFSEAERKISAEMARARVTAMRDLLSSAREMGLHDPEFQSLLSKAESALESKDFDVIEEYKEEFEERLEEAKLRHKTEISGSKIKNAMNTIAQFKEQGIDMDRAEEIMTFAEKEFNAQNFEKAEEYSSEAEKIAEELSQRHDTKQELGSVMDVMSEAIATGVDVEEANDLLNQAEDEMNANNLAKAKELIENARSVTSSNIQQFIQNKYPKLIVNLPEEGMEADAWNKCSVEIENIGNLLAKNVDIVFRGDVEVKGIERIEKLDAGENMQMEIGLKPKKDGELDMDVYLAYQRAFDDRIYQLNLAKKLIVDSSGTYQIEEVLLIHKSGVLITQASRKLEMDIDRDIFSSMFTAVQEFIKDSFGRQDDAGLKRMDFGSNKILIEHGNHTFLTAILAGGEPRYLPLYMVEVLREVEQKYGAVLDEWRGLFAGLEGIDDIIGKLLQVTDERGADVEGFESGVVASTIKLVESAERAGVRVGGEEAFVEEFLRTMEEEGYEHAWEYLEKTGNEVNMEIGAETARETITAMKELMRFAKESGMDEAEFLSLLDESEKAFEAKEFKIIDGFKEKFERKLEEAKLKQKTDIILRRIKNAMVVLTQFKELGINVEKPEKLLIQADLEFQENDFSSAERDVDQAEKLADELRKRHDFKMEIEYIRETVYEMREMQIEIEGVDDCLTQAENEVNVSNFSNAKELMGKANDIISTNVEHFIKDKFPKLSLTLPERGFEAASWNKCLVEIGNEGNLMAKNIDISFRGDVEVKGVERIKKLPPQNVEGMEIGLKPTKGGELDIEVRLKYQRVFDDTIYQLDLRKKVKVEESGTYVLENIFLIHNNGVLIAQMSRKLEMDVDHDIFSGMLTAIQEFIKDSFKKNLEVGLKRMDFGTNKIMIEHGRYTFLTTVLSGGEPKLLPLYMLEVLKEVEQKYGPVLNKWDGTYSKLEGVNDILGKLMLVTEEKGTEVEGFESGATASTVKLIESAKKEGVEIVAPEDFADEISDIIEREGFERAWSYLEEIGQEVKRSSEAFRVKKEGMEELRHAFLRDMDERLIRDIGESLENYLVIVDRIIKVILKMREELNLKPSIPIKKVAIKSPDETVRDALNKLRSQFLNMVNAKDLEIIRPDTEWEGLKLELIPKRDTITRAYKQQASKVETLLRYQSPWKIKRAIEKAGEYTLGVEGYPVKITAKMLEFKLSTPENVVVNEFDSGTIYLD
ncbi:MAG: hypothetical protein JSV09_05975, partial [Thermoplasmata archaeon]